MCFPSWRWEVSSTPRADCVPLMGQRKGRRNSCQRVKPGGIISSCYLFFCLWSVCVPSVPRTELLSLRRHTTHYLGRDSLTSSGVCLSLAPRWTAHPLCALFPRVWFPHYSVSCSPLGHPASVMRLQHHHTGVNWSYGKVFASLVPRPDPLLWLPASSSNSYLTFLLQSLGSPSSDPPSQKALPIPCPAKWAHLHLNFVHIGTVFPSSSLGKITRLFLMWTTLVFPLPLLPHILLKGQDLHGQLSVMTILFLPYCPQICSSIGPLLAAPGTLLW